MFVYFTSKGAGDIYIKAECMLVSKTYGIEDCIYYNLTGVTINSSTSSDIQQASGLEAFEFTPPTNWEYSFDLEADSYGKRWYLVSKPQSSSGNNRYGLGGNVDTTYNQIGIRTTSSSFVNASKNGNKGSWKFVVEGTSVKQYFNDNLERTSEVSWFNTYAPYYFKWGTWNTGTATVTNIKIKPL